VPVKSLCRFMSVSKQWRALISNPAFVAAHESRAEPLLVSSYSNNTRLQLTDMDGNIVRRMKGVVDGPLIFGPSVSCFDELACFADGSPNPHVIDLATGGCNPFPSEARRAGMVPPRLWPHRSIPFVQGGPLPMETDLFCSHDRRRSRVEANAIPRD
jgi:hypothetical protein